MVLLILQKLGRVETDPFIGAVGMLVISAFNAAAGTWMLVSSKSSA
jgi:hypothetical protein